MKYSLSLRLLATAAITTLVALIATGFILNSLFRTFFENRIHQELEAYLVQITANISVSPEGELSMAKLSDPRFSEPLSGLYWQAQLQERPPVLSQSFWGSALDIPRPQNRGTINFLSVSDGDADYLTSSWIVTISREGNDAEVFLTVALDQNQFDESVAGFSQYVVIALGVLGSFLVLASWLQVRIGLKPLEKIRSEVANIKENHGQKLSKNHPTEVQPLVDEVNDLLERRNASINLARARASDLAHGLKTPLTIMRAISADLQASHRAKIAKEIDDQVENMQFFVERELARSLDQAIEIKWCKTAPVVNRVVSAFKRSSAKLDLDWQIEADQDAECPFDEFSLTELLGNLVDNAEKWTETKIRVTVSGSRESGFIEILDDGPGISEDNIRSALTRGEQLGASVSGQGLGLAIVDDMVHQRGARLELLNGDPVGLIVRVSWKSQDLKSRQKHV